MTKHERKLRKKAKKLAKWAKKHDIEHVNMFVSAPNSEEPRWFADFTAYVGELRVVSASDFYAEEEL